MTGLNRLIVLLAQQREQLGPPTWGQWPHAHQTWSRLAHSSTRVLDQFRPADTSMRASDCILANLALNTPAMMPTPGVYQPLSTLTETLGTIADLLSRTPPDTTLVAHAAGTIVRNAVQTTVATAADWTLQGLPRPPRGFGMLASQLDRLAHAPIAQPTVNALSLYPWRAPTPGQLDHAVATWHDAAQTTLNSPQHITQLALQLTAADIALICLTTAHALRDNTHLTGGHQLSTPLLDAARSWRDAARWPATSRLGGRTDQLRDASATLRAAILARKGLESDRLEAVLWSLRVAQSAAVQHTAFVGAIARGQKGVWLTRGQANLDSRRRAPRDLGWILDAAPSNDALKLVRDSDLALRLLSSARTDIDEHIASRRPLGELPVWEIVSPPNEAQSRRLAENLKCLLPITMGPGPVAGA